MFPLLSKMNILAVKQDPEEPSAKKRANKSFTWMKLGDCPQDASIGSKTVFRDFSTKAAFTFIVAFGSAGSNI